MPSPSEMRSHSDLRLKTALLLVAVGINALEFFIPRVPLFPWIKPGLANVITMYWIMRFGIMDGLLYSLIRIWAVTFFFGFSYFTFLLGFSGAVIACLAMGISWRLLGQRKILGSVGLAITGAFGHNLGQLAVVYGLMGSNTHLLYQIPAMAFAAVLFGTIVGLLLPAVVDATGGLQSAAHEPPRVPAAQAPDITRVQTVLALLLFAVCMLLTFVNDWRILAAAALTISLLVQLLQRGSLAALLQPLSRFWMLFLFVALLQGFFTFGTRVPLFPLLTFEGLEATLIQWLRLWSWLQAAFLFKHLRFHALLFKGLGRLFPGHQVTLSAGLLALEYFPAATAAVQSKLKSLLKLLITRPPQAVQEIFGIIASELKAPRG